MKRREKKIICWQIKLYEQGKQNEEENLLKLKLDFELDTRNAYAYHKQNEHQKKKDKNLM